MVRQDQIKSIYLLFLNKLSIIYSNINKEMGANESSTLPLGSFRQQQWEAIPIRAYTKLKDPFYGSNFKVIANKLNRSIELQKYDLVFNSQNQYSAYKELIVWRNSNRFIAAAKYIHHTKENGLCNNFFTASVFFQRMPVRLYEIEDISLEQGLYIIYAATQGFQKLYEKYGHFEIDQEMIFFNKQGYVKVWANKNLAKSYPQNVIIHNKNKNYQNFVGKVLTLVEDLIDFQGNPTLSSFIRNKSIKNPFLNISQTLELYVKDINVNIPRYLSSIRNLCKNNKKSKNIQTKQGKTRNPFQTSPKDRRKVKLESGDISSFNYMTQTVNTPIRRSNQLTYPPEEPVLKKRHSFMINLENKASRSPQVSFQYNRTIESPKNQSHRSQDEYYRKSKIYSTIDVSQLGYKKPLDAFNTSYLLTNEEYLQMDPQIAADILRIAASSM